MYVIDDTSTMRLIARKITWGTHQSAQMNINMYSGYFRYKWCAFGYFPLGNIGNFREMVYIFTTPKVWNELTSNSDTLDCKSSSAPIRRSDEPGTSQSRSHITIHLGKNIPSPSGMGTYFSESSLELRRVFPSTPSQKMAVEKITSFFKEHGHCVALLQGPIGVGKSFVSYLLATYYMDIPAEENEMDQPVSMCNSILPWTPLSSISHAYRLLLHKPTRNRPFIIVFDEIETAFAKLVRGIDHPRYPIEIHDKASWNLFLDNMCIGAFSNVILLLTTNATCLADYTNGDTSFYRTGRIDITLNFEKPEKEDNKID